MGMSRVAGSVFNFRVAVRPSIPGNRMSMRMMSGGFSVSVANASGALAASHIS